MARPKSPKEPKLIEQYVSSKAASWSETTAVAERARLRGITLTMLQEPATLLKYLQEERKLKPYSLKTTWTRAGEFAQFLIEAGVLPQPNKVKEFKRQNALLFKYTYEPKRLEESLTFEEAHRRIETIEDLGLREKAKQLLYTGLRYEESTTLDAEGRVTGKGGLKRDALQTYSDFDPKRVQEGESYFRLYRALKKIGLTPHALRKLCATFLAENGAQEADLMQAMGWRSSAMATVYVQARKKKELVEKLRSMKKKETKEPKKNGI
jgi:integrase